MAAHNVTTKKDIVKPLQYTQESASIITGPTTYGVTPTSSPTFVAAGLNTEITINPDIVHQDVDALGSEDIVDAVKTGELYTFTTRFNPTDTVLLNYGLVAGAGTGNLPWAQSTNPSPTFRSEDLIVSKFKDSMAHTPPTISTIESIPPIS